MKAKKFYTYQRVLLVKLKTTHITVIITCLLFAADPTACMSCSVSSALLTHIYLNSFSAEPMKYKIETLFLEEKQSIYLINHLDDTG